MFPMTCARSRKLAQVFLSYAREDEGAARRLYADLRRSHIPVWFDKESLLPGRDWKLAIREAVRNSRFFIAILSSKSVDKVGYVQSEMHQAKDILSEYPGQSVFLIPVRLDACTPREDWLLDIQWVDMFPAWDEGLRRIIETIRSQT